jgi:hypothetical protein
MFRKTLRIFLIIYLVLLLIGAVVATFVRKYKIEHDHRAEPLIIFILGAAGIALVCVVLCLVAFLVLWSLFDLMKSEFKLTHNKILWVVLILLLPVIGTVFYLLISPEQKILPADRKVSF